MSSHPDSAPAIEAVLTLCRQCDPARFPGQVSAMREACLDAGISVVIRGQDCLNCCEMPQALAIHSAGGAACVFHGVDATKDLGDIVKTIGAYLQADRGWIEDAMACGRLRTCLRARIAALQSTLTITS